LRRFREEETPMRNLELKIACDAAAFEEIQRKARALGPSFMHSQRDTYFAVPSGRLKLRELDDGYTRSAELIGYTRPDVEGARWSSYYRAQFSPGEIAPLKAMMERTIGVRVVVSKVREVIAHRRTRIHLDQVEHLGQFVELETVMSDDVTDSEAELELAEVVELLGLGQYAAVAGSYCDLMEAAVAKARLGTHTEVSE
jgi:adenylate cyclase class IV